MKPATVGDAVHRAGTPCDGCGRNFEALVRVVHVRVSLGYVLRTDQPVQIGQAWGPDLVLCGDCFQLRTGLAGLLELARARASARGGQ